MTTRQARYNRLYRIYNGDTTSTTVPFAALAELYRAGDPDARALITEVVGGTDRLRAILHVDTHGPVTTHGSGTPCLPFTLPPDETSGPGNTQPAVAAGHRDPFTNRATLTTPPPWARPTCPHCRGTGYTLRTYRGDTAYCLACHDHWLDTATTPEDLTQPNDTWCRNENCEHRHWVSGPIPTHRRGNTCPPPR